MASLAVVSRFVARCIVCACLTCAASAMAQTLAKKSKPLAQQPAEPPKSYRIGVLSQGNPPTNEISGNDFRQGLRDLSYVDGRNVAVEFRYGVGKIDQLPELADERRGRPPSNLR